MRRGLTRVTIVCVMLAVVLPGGVESATSKRTSVESLRAYSKLVRAKATSSLPVRAEELFQAMNGNAATLQQPIRFLSGESVYLFHGRQGALCSVLAVSSQATGFCSTLLREASGRLSVGVTVISGKTFAWGIVSNTVKDVSARIGDITRQGRITNNALIIDLPDGSRGSGPILLTVRGHDGSVLTHRLPGIPHPPS